MERKNGFLFKFKQDSGLLRVMKLNGLDDFYHQIKNSPSFSFSFSMILRILQKDYYFNSGLSRSLLSLQTNI